MKLFRGMLLCFAVMALLCGCAMADDVIGTVSVEKEPVDLHTLNLPDMQAGVVYSAVEGDFNTCATLSLLSYETPVGDIQLRGGYAFDEEEVIGSLCFKLGDLTQYGVAMPLHHLINVSAGPYIGYRMKEQEEQDKWDYGLTVTIVQVSF